MAYICFGVFVCGRGKGFICWLLGVACGVLGVLFVLGGYVDRQAKNEHDGGHIFQHNGKNVSQKHLTHAALMYYSYSSEADMANVLNTDRQITVVAALAEGSSIRSIERMTGIHRDTIMRLGVRVGQGCTRVMDATMRDLPCERLEMDEIWG
jgi:hypothetical protein